jgi:tRNA-binding EMAP/Myf-like protein
MSSFLPNASAASIAFATFSGVTSNGMLCSVSFGAHASFAT